MFKCGKCGQEFKGLVGLSNHLRNKNCDIIIKCLNPNCNNIIKRPNKYCSLSCAAKIVNKGHIVTKETRIKLSISHGGTGEVKKNKCLNCGKDVILSFCNNTCKGDYNLKIKIEKWLAGEINGNSRAGHAFYVKRYLIQKYNNKCSKCGWGEINQFSKNIPLEVEHIDGNPYNNNPNNVDLICPNCHSLTKTYRGLNKGNGRREYLKKYYIRDMDGKII